MSQGASGIFVRHTAQAVSIRVIGRGSFQNSRPLRLFAADMIERLTLYMNRVRQSSITKEIIEVVSGAAAAE